jgi:hypothetical protein
MAQSAATCQFTKGEQMESSEDYGLLIEWLKDRGHTPEEIEKIMARVHVFDEETQHDSVMDSIGAGRMNLDAFIKDALKD